MPFRVFWVVEAVLVGGGDLINEDSYLWTFTDYGGTDLFAV